MDSSTKAHPNDLPSCSKQVNFEADSDEPPDTISATLDDDARLAARLTNQSSEESLNGLECASDAALALILQRQFDLEYDDQLKKQEARLNGLSKVGISLDNFRRTPRSNSAYEVMKGCVIDGSSEDDEEQLYSNMENKIDSNLAAWDVFEQSELKQRSRTLGRAGFFIDEDGSVITKHDIPTSGRRNMCRLMELKTDIQTGDAGAFKDDFKINNNVYNRLKVHSKKSSRRASQRAFDKKERENEAILQDIHSIKMSDATRAIMDGLLIAFKIEKLNGVIGHGKESTILHATGRDHEDTPGQEVAVKIFKSDSSMAFKTRDTYNKSKCPSYKFDKPKSKNDALNKWAERGFKNLKLLRKVGINCPDAISLKKHVLVMTFLGDNARPSPQLKEARLNELQLRQSYEQIIDIVVKMYQECELIHGDLSEYNLLWHNDQVYVIDVSQSMLNSHPNANSFLFRDCKNILDFFQKSGLTDILEASELFKLVCGKDLTQKDIELWTMIEDFPKNEKLMQRDKNKPDNFEHMFRSTTTKE